MLRGRDHPVSAKDLWAQEHAAGYSTGLATIYRALHALTAAGIVHEFRHDDETTYRACGPECHDHLVCRACGRIQELHLPWRTHHFQQLLQDGFVADEYSVQVCSATRTVSGPRPAEVERPLGGQVLHLGDEVPSYGIGVGSGVLGVGAHPRTPVFRARIRPCS